MHIYKFVFRSISSRYLIYSFNLLSVMVLARIFSPQDYGIISAVMVFFTFFQMIAEGGLGSSIISLKVLNQHDRDGIFSLTLLIGIITAAFFFALAPYLEYFYNLTNISDVIRNMAISLFFFSASVVPNSFLTREKAFFSIAASGIFAEIFSTIAVVIISHYLTPLNALSLKITLSSSSQFFLYWYFSKKTDFGRPFLNFNFYAIQKIWGLMRYQIGFNFINFFSRNLDNILIGKYISLTALGIYDRAYQLMKYPLILLTHSMTPAIQPFIREYSDNLEKVESIHRDFTYKLSLLGCLAGLIIYIFSDLIILILFGKKWLDVIPILKILSISIPAQVVLSTSGSFLQGINKQKVLFQNGIFSAILLTIFFLIALHDKNIKTFCWFLILAVHIIFIYTYYNLYKNIFKVNFKLFLNKMYPLMLVVLLMTIFNF